MDDFLLGVGSDEDLSWLYQLDQLDPPPLFSTILPTTLPKPSPVKMYQMDPLAPPASSAPSAPSAPAALAPASASTLDQLIQLLSSESPPRKKQRLSVRRKPKTRTMRSITPQKDYGWNEDGTIFRGCVGVQVGGEPKYEQWTKAEVHEKLSSMITEKWKWTEAEAERSHCNLARWLHKVVDMYGDKEFDPKAVQIFKLAHKKGGGKKSRLGSAPGGVKFYPPYEALCCGYEVSRCPFTEVLSTNNTKMRLSPVFVERLKAHGIL